MEDRFMTFRPKDLATVPTDTPDVEIFFYGQLFLRSDGATCEVAVNQLATNHVLTVEARTRVAGQLVDVRMRHVGHLNFRQREGMLIEVRNPDNTPATTSPAAWNCRTFGPINYESGEEPPNNPPGDDFRWILNLEGPLFHNKTLNPPIFASHHVIRLQGGEYFFRTARRTSGRFDMLRQGGGMNDARFKKIGAVAKASVFLTGDQRVVLNWQGPVTERDHALTLVKQTNTTHEIYINNAPLFLNEVNDNEDLTRFDELIEYYKLIRLSEVALADRFTLVPATPTMPTGLEGGSPDIPCQVMRLDGMTES
jgi:hypothetical protein